MTRISSVGKSVPKLPYCVSYDHEKAAPVLSAVYMYVSQRTFPTLYHLPTVELRENSLSRPHITQYYGFLTNLSRGYEETIKY